MASAAGRHWLRCLPGKCVLAPDGHRSRSEFPAMGRLLHRESITSHGINILINQLAFVSTNFSENLRPPEKKSAICFFYVDYGCDYGCDYGYKSSKSVKTDDDDEIQLLSRTEHLRHGELRATGIIRLKRSRAAARVPELRMICCCRTR